MKAIFDVIVGDVLYAVTKKLDSVHEIKVNRLVLARNGWDKYVFFEWNKSEYHFSVWTKESNVVYSYNERPSTNIKKTGCSSPYKGILAIFSDFDDSSPFLSNLKSQCILQFWINIHNNILSFLYAHTNIKNQFS